MYSSNVVSYIELEGKHVPIYGCGLKKEKLKYYVMKDAKKKGICLDWLHNRCVYKDEECRFRHELPPRVSPEERERMLEEKKRIAELRREASQPEWAKRKDRAQKLKAAKRRPKVNVVGALASKPIKKAMSMDTQNATTSVCEEMSTSSGSKVEFLPEIPTDGWEEELVEVPLAEVVSSTFSAVPAPKVHMPTDFVPAILEPPVLTLNANASEYTPTYAESNAGSLYSSEDHFAMSTSYTPAPSIHGSVYGEPTHYANPVAPPVVPSLPTPQYQPVPYVHPNTAAALQNMNAQLTAQASALNASRDQIHQYQTELAKVQRETAIMMRHHETAMKQLASEKFNQRMHYERQLEELRKQTMDALNTVKVQQRALQADAQLKELPRRKMEVVRQPAVFVQEQVVPVQVPHEEVVHPESTTTFFTSNPLTSLVIPPMDAPEVPVSKPAPVKPLSERVPKPAEAPKAVALEVVPEATTPTEEPVVKTPKEVALEVVPEAAVPAEEPVRRLRKKRVRKAKVQAEPVPDHVAEEAVVKPVKETVVIPETHVQQAKVAEEPVVKPVKGEPVVISETPVQQAKVTELCSTELPTLRPQTRTVKPAPTPIVHAPATKWATVMRKTAAPVKTQPAPAQASKQTVTARQSYVKKHRCIFEIFDRQDIRKAGICMDYMMGLCKSDDCYCWKKGCNCSQGRARHAYKQIPWFNCKYLHEVPKVKKASKISSEERKYRERKLGVKKTRLSKRDRFDRQNKRSLEVARKRFQQRKQQALSQQQATVL